MQNWAGPEQTASAASGLRVQEALLAPAAGSPLLQLCPDGSDRALVRTSKEAETVL